MPEDIEEITTIQIALNKQLPNKYIEDEFEISNGGLLSFIPVFKCGKCNKTIKHEVNYCEHCGQKINWTNQERENYE